MNLNCIKAIKEKLDYYNHNSSCVGVRVYLNNGDTLTLYGNYSSCSPLQTQLFNIVGIHEKNFTVLLCSINPNNSRNTNKEMISIHLNHILGLQLEKIRYQKIKTKEAKPKQDKSTQQKLRDDITTHQNVIKPINVHSTSKQVKRLPDPKVKQTISNDTKQNNDEKPKKEENNEQNLVPSNTESRTKPHKPPIKTDQADNESNDDFNKKIVILVSLLLYSIFRTISEFIAMEQSKDEADHKEDRPSKEEEKDDKPCESQYPPKKPEENCKE